MLPKIRYRLVWNYANKLNMQGQAPVAVECRQSSRKIYISSNVLLSQGQWQQGMVVNHDSYVASDEPAAYGILMVFNGSPAGGGFPIAQMFFASEGNVYSRIKFAWTQGTWTSWRTL